MQRVKNRAATAAEAARPKRGPPGLALGFFVALGGAFFVLGLERLFLAFFLTIHTLGHAVCSAKI